MTAVLRTSLRYHRIWRRFPAKQSRFLNACHTWRRVAKPPDRQPVDVYPWRTYEETSFCCAGFAFDFGPRREGAGDTGLNAKAGDTISLENRAIFYIDRKCELPIVNAKSMRHYVFYRGKNGPNEVGCWGATIDDMVFTVAPRAEPFTAPLEVLLFADVDQNGTAKIIGKYSKSQK